MHPKDEYTPQPIDNIDKACMKHDKCYSVSGYFNRSCDEALINELKSIESTDKTAEVTRLMIISFFKSFNKIQDGEL